MKLRIKFKLGAAQMQRSQGYKTRQRALILELLTKHHDEHLSVDDIISLLSQQGETVGRATVYRSLDRLAEQGLLRRYSAGERAGACYQLTGRDCHSHYHLKCTGCGALLHLECEQLDELIAHIYEHHGFGLDPAQTVLYGCCADCAAKKENTAL